jgi:hypothetical protein
VAVYSPLNDPAYQAYMAESEWEKQSRHHQMWERIGSKQRMWNAQQPGYQLQQQAAGTNIDNDYESRGFYHSGARMAERAQAFNTIEAQRRVAEQGYYEDVHNEQASAMRDMGRVTTQQAMQEYQARARQQLFEYNRMYG